MDNSKRNIHSSGPLGILVKSGQVKRISEISNGESSTNLLRQSKTSNGAYFKTQSGIEFTENELIFLDPKECEPWEYANRQHDEMGEIEELTNSVKRNTQLQPALVRKHPHPHDTIKYEIIFGRRRHAACLNLNIPFLVICKDVPDIKGALALQDAENKFRSDISNYSNAVLYKRLLEDRVFNSEKELSESLKIPYSTFNDLMTYTRIPKDIILHIPNIHNLSKSMALKIVSLLSQKENNHAKILQVADKIGKSITSPLKLENALQKIGQNTSISLPKAVTVFQSEEGKKIFTAKVDSRGNYCLIFKQNILDKINLQEITTWLRNYIEEKIS